MLQRRHRLRATAALVVLALGVAPGTAPAATKHGITPLAPAAGSTVTKGRALTFRMRVRGSGKVFVHVCRSTKKAKDGTICSRSTIGQGKRHDGVVTFRQRLYDYPAYWLNTPGTYYWQAYRIDCPADGSDCRQEGPVTRFRVR